MARQRIDAPPVSQPLYGLIRAAATWENVPDDAWGAGWTFQPEGCGVSGVDVINCDGTSDARDDLDGINPEALEGDPFVVYALDRCSTIGGVRDYEGRARRQLLASQSAQIARELWTGTLAQADNLGNPWLTDPSSDTVTNGGVDPEDALASVVGAWASCSNGQPAMVHVTPQILALLVSAQSVYRDGDLWRTPMGYVVSADAGYDGSGPGGTPAVGTQWIYATPVPRIGLNEILIQQWTDQRQNTVYLWAQREVAYQFPNFCCHIAAEVNVPVPLVGAPS